MTASFRPKKVWGSKMCGETRQTTESAKVLIVDDSRANLLYLRALLESCGYLVITANNGMLALSLAADEAPDLVLLDINMPGLDGYEVCRRFKSDDKSCSVPVIFISTLNDPNDKITGFEAGAVDFITKPFHPKELLSRVESHLALRAMQKRLELHNAELEQEITERRRIESQLQENKTTLEKLVCELKTTQSRILQQEKMACIGQLAAGVAHEINNPIGYIISNLTSLRKYVARMVGFISETSDILALDHSAQAREFLERVAALKKTLKLDYIMEDAGFLIDESSEGADRIRQIVQDLKNFSHLNDEEFKAADINSGIESTINIVYNELKYKTTLVRELGELPPVVCNLGQLNQVFMNLLLNAAQAIEKQGVITVRSWYENKSVVICISDTGSGIPPEHLDRIFEPFYTTKEIGKGTGLGLSIAYDIIKRHDGSIQVESEVGRGTTFRIIIPVKERDRAGI